MAKAPRSPGRVRAGGIPQYDGVVQLIRFVFLAVTVLVTATGYIQEGRRLNRIRELPGRAALAHYERGRARGERMMWAVALALAAGALYSVYLVWAASRWGGQ